MTQEVKPPVLGDVVRRRLEDLLGPDAVAPAPARERDRASPTPSGSQADSSPRGSPAGAALRLVRMGREHLVVVAIIALAGCLWAGYQLTSARSLPVAVASVTAATASATPKASATPQVLVHVLGAVKSPGVVRLPQGSRVQDALAAAGGLRSDARPGELNLAAPVADGAQIVVGTTDSPGGEVRGAETAAGAGGAGPGLLNLNTATAEQLDTLPGVGPVTAQAIVAWRTSHGRFTRVEELGEVDGIGPKTYAQLAPKVTV